MIRVASTLASILLVACASTPSRDLLATQPLERRPGEAIADNGSTPLAGRSEATPSSSSIELDADATEHDTTLPASPLTPVLFSALPEEGLRHSRTTIKGGLYSSEDAEELDDGYIINVSWMRFFTGLFALELEAGYLSADGEDSGVDGEVWGVPLMVNGRLNLPVWILDVYGGLGAGGIYYDAEVGTAEDDGFLLGGNAFLGATISLADAIALGLEAKYYATEDIDEFDTSLEAFALMLTLGFSR